MDIRDKGGYTFDGLSKINILLGKNGCGKSTSLKTLETELSRDRAFGKIKYITPERGGRLKYEPNVDHNMSTNERWLADSRRQNQFDKFREQSVVQYRKLELLTLRELERDAAKRHDSSYTFDTVIERINSLLDNIKIKRSDSDFSIHEKDTDAPIAHDHISSGEAELISLGIEMLVFEKECAEGIANVLLLDEPDVHLHPDLQARLGRFLQTLAELSKFTTIVATHSTALLGCFSDYPDLSLAFMLARQKAVTFRPVADIYKKVLPVFGAHPLSNVFNEAPVFLVEGEDDERIWQQAVRSSKTRLKLYPCSVDGVGNLPQYETEVKHIVAAVYDSAVAYSLRDRDENNQDVSDDLPLVRFQLECRAAENLLLADEVLASLGTSWDLLKTSVAAWVERNPDHPNIEVMRSFVNASFPRKTFDLKPIRNDIMGITGSSKPWEVAVGQVLGRTDPEDDPSEHSIWTYLGEKLVKRLFVSAKRMSPNKASRPCADARP